MRNLALLLAMTGLALLTIAALHAHDKPRHPLLIGSALQACPPLPNPCSRIDCNRRKIERIA